MEYPKTGGEALAVLREKFGKRALADLERASGVAYSTLNGWRKSPNSRFTAKAEKKWDSVFRDGEPVFRPAAAEPRHPYAVSSSSELAATLAALLAGQERIERRFDALMKLRQDEPVRFEQMVRSKARSKAGGAA
jgi:hypothetical protein